MRGNYNRLVCPCRQMEIKQKYANFITKIDRERNGVDIEHTKFNKCQFTLSLSQRAGFQFPQKASYYSG